MRKGLLLYGKTSKNMSQRILFVEDDESLGFVTHDQLIHNGFEVDWARNGEEGLKFFDKNLYSLCILDVMMPHMDGFSLAQHIRQKDEFVPILFLTARSDEEDRLKGFEVGGDDYIPKPFSIQELIYRIKVFLRRSQVSHGSTEKTEKIGNYMFDFENQKLQFEDEEYPLTQMESELIKMLSESRNNLVSREDILVQIWGENDYFKGRSLDVFISRLRKYFKKDPAIEIKNHHGVGFTLKC